MSELPSPSDTAPLTDLLLELYDTQQAAAYGNLVVGIVFGAYVVVYGTSLYLLLRKGGLLRSAPRLFMLVATTALFGLGLIALVLETTLAYQQFTREIGLFASSSGSLWSTRRTNITTAVGATITCIIYVISDIVCAWRAAVLWNYDRRVLTVLSLFVLGTIAAAGSDLGLGLSPLFGPSSSSKAGSSAILRGGGRPLILVGPTLATNFLSTSLIGLQAWRKRHKLIDHLGRYGLAIQTEKIFALLVESGFAYCCFWILYLISAFQVFPDPGFAVMDAVLPYVSSLYPTVVIIFVVLRKSPTFMITKRHANAHFSQPPPLSRSRMETRIPLSMMYTPREDQLHTGSDTTALSSPLFDSKDKL